MVKGATDPNTGKVLKRNTWIGINSTNSSTINPYVLEIVYVKSNTTNFNRLFYNFNNLTNLDVLDDFDTSAVTNMGDMFAGCSSLVALDLSNFDTSQVTQMWGMFTGCTSLVTLDLSGFDTSNVIDMSSIFYRCHKLTYITIGSNFFKTTQVIPFRDAPILGLNPDGSDNGWLSHLSSVAPEITDGQGRTIQLHSNLKNKPWAQPYLAILQDKGYTIS